MKRIIPILILTSCYFISFSQKGEIRISTLTIAFNGDSAHLMEKYEIDFSKRKVYQFTTIANYLHVGRKKLKNEMRLTKSEWKEIAMLGLVIDLEKLTENSDANTDNNAYFIESTLNNGDTLGLKLAEENMSQELKRLFEKIRNSK